MRMITILVPTGARIRISGVPGPCCSLVCRPTDYTQKVGSLPQRAKGKGKGQRQEDKAKQQRADVRVEHRAIQFVRSIRFEPGVRRLIEQFVASAASIAA